jgi:anaerobic ribonucleoside-triphosphate reductase activating protein
MSTKVRIAGIVNDSIVDGPGIRLTVFAQGCRHNCLGCHNLHTHDFDGGSLIEIDSILQRVKSNPLLDGVTLSGGEPFEQANALGELAEKVKSLGYNVMTYTGYTYEHIMKNRDSLEGWSKLIANTDILVDGRFELPKRNLLLKFKGSENQRIIDVKQSISNNELVELQL